MEDSPPGRPGSPIFYQLAEKHDNREPRTKNRELKTRHSHRAPIPRYFPLRASQRTKSRADISNQPSPSRPYSTLIRKIRNQGDSPTRTRLPQNKKGSQEAALETRK